MSAMTHGGLSQSHCQFSNGNHERSEVDGGTCPTGQRSFSTVEKVALGTFLVTIVADGLVGHLQQSRLPQNKNKEAVFQFFWFFWRIACISMVINWRQWFCAKKKFTYHVLFKTLIYTGHSLFVSNFFFFQYFVVNMTNETEKGFFSPRNEEKFHKIYVTISFKSSVNFNN